MKFATIAVTAALAASAIGVETVAAQAGNCFAPDQGAASLDRAVHSNWARVHGASEIKSNLDNKIRRLFACPTRTPDQLADSFADLSLVIAHYVTNAACFNGDAGVVSTDRMLHRNWAILRDRKSMAQNARWKASAAFNCLDGAGQLEYFADMSLVLASGTQS